MKPLTVVLLAGVLAGGAVACDRDTTAKAPEMKVQPINVGNDPPAPPQPTAPSMVDTSVYVPKPA